MNIFTIQVIGSVVNPAHATYVEQKMQFVGQTCRLFVQDTGLMIKTNTSMHVSEASKFSPGSSNLGSHNALKFMCIGLHILKFMSVKSLLEI